MVLESVPPVFLHWIWPGAGVLLVAALLLGLLVLGVGFLVAAFRHGPLAGGDIVYRMVRTAIGDFVALSPRRILALARLAIQESRAGACS